MTTPDRQLPRDGELWAVVVPGSESARAALLVAGAPRDEYLDVWVRGYLVDGAVAHAGPADYLLTADEVAWVAGADGLRVAVEYPVHVRLGALRERVGQLTTPGRRMWAAHGFGVPNARSAARYGSAATDPADPRRVALAALVAERHAAVDAIVGPVDESAEPRLRNEAALDAAWVERIALAPGLETAVDLLGGDGPVGLLADPAIDGLADLADSIATNDDASAALRRLAVAEARIASRPASLWVVDAAAAAREALVALGPLAASATALEALARRRAAQASLILPSLSYDTLGADVHDPPLTSVLGAAIAPILHSEDVDTTDLASWQAGAVEGIRGVLSHGDGIERPTENQLAGRVLSAAGSTIVVVLDGDVLDAEVVGPAPRIELSTPDGERSLVNLTVELRASVAAAYDERSERLAEGVIADGSVVSRVWALAIEPRTGAVTGATPLEVDPRRGVLFGALDLGPTRDRHLVWITSQTKPVLDLHRVLERLVSAPPEDVAQQVRQARALATEFVSQAPGLFASASRAQAQALAQLADAMTSSVPAGPSLPTGTERTAGARLVDAARHRRAILRFTEEQAMGTDAEATAERQALDRLLS